MSTSESSCKESASKSNDDGVCDDMIGKLQNISTDDNTDNKEDIVLSVCANCGKGEEEGSNLKSCAACKLVKYCSRDCQQAHRLKHKRECKKRAAELHDIELFKQPPPPEDCPICFQQLPILETGSKYQTCCGKVICSGCMHAPLYDNQGNEVDNQKCPFCRTPHPTGDEIIERLNKRVEVEDPLAIHNLGVFYRDGTNGFPQDDTKALELFHQLGELGHAKAYCSIGYYYHYGRAVRQDKKKATHYLELAAMKGDADARCNLGIAAAKEGNWERALKHFMIAVRSGHDDSLEKIQQLYSIGSATKEEYTKALQFYQAYLGEIKSPQRDKAAATYEECRYY